ncbi:MAG TPA: RNA 3'-terminal phosphate cyclase [Candidatus Altiarchaeales archaeon]|nr:RNA 3'-terminal phosphate cyclase [Candidatus Altiarchaeales archaeon]
MISIDGSLGEGGGQILRTSVALAALTGSPVEIKNIRAKRPNPGLRAQHLAAIKAVAMISNAKLEGAKIGSSSLKFIPSGEIRGGNLSIDVGTAGSISLVLQALMIPVVNLKEKLKIKLRGGTDVKFSPSIDYLRFVTLPLLKKFGYKAEIEVEKRGYYPKGNGVVIAKFYPSEMKEISLEDRGKIKELIGISHASIELSRRKVAERQAKTARLHLYNNFLNKFSEEIKSRIDIEYCTTDSIGSGISIFAICENSILGEDVLGEKGKRAETVGEECANGLIKTLESGASLDKYMGDQIVPYIAILGGRATVSEVTQHLKTNVLVAKKFGFNIELKGNEIINC